MIKFKCAAAFAFAALAVYGCDAKDQATASIQVEAPDSVNFQTLPKKSLDTLIREKWDAKEYANIVEMSTYALETHQSMSAAHHLGLSYFNGYGTDKDLDKALVYFMNPLLDGDRWTEYRIGQILSDPNYPGQNIDNAKYYLKNAADMGVKPAGDSLKTL